MKISIEVIQEIKQTTFIMRKLQGTFCPVFLLGMPLNFHYIFSIFTQFSNKGVKKSSVNVLINLIPIYVLKS